MSLGLVDTSNRKVRPISELGNLVNFGNLQMTDPIISKDGDVPQTVEYMKEIVRNHHMDVAEIADRLEPRKNTFLHENFLSLRAEKTTFQNSSGANVVQSRKRKTLFFLLSDE